MSATPVTIPQLLRSAAEEYDDHTAYVQDGRRMSFSELHATVRGVARGLVAHGLAPRDRVVVWGPNSIDWVVAALAVTYAGGVLVPANSRYTGAEVADLVQRTGAPIVLLEDGFLGRNQIRELETAGELVCLQEIVQLSDLAHVTRTGTQVPEADLDARAAAVTADDVADILFTSGTTGRSKGAMSAHRQSIGVSRAWAQLGGVRQDDRYLVVNPFFHSFGYKIGILVGLLTGCTLYPVATFDLAATMRLIQDEQITVLPGAPTIYQSILSAPSRG